VTSKACWIEAFREFVKRETQIERFPLQPDEFNEQALRFADTQVVGDVSAKDFFWFRDGRVKASYMTFTVDVSVKTASGSALEYKKLWDAYLVRWNSQAKIFSKGAWHTAALWVRAEAQDELISSTVVTLLVVVLLAFLGMVVFTRNFMLSLLVVITTCLVVVWLLWYIVALMMWKIGPIEVISLIVFIGYAVTYSLHIAHRYSCRAAHCFAGRSLLDQQLVRQQRLRFALKTIGCSMLGGAATTVGCAAFLLFCTLTIFQQLGSVVLAVTLISIVMALLPLPAALLLVGPLNPGQCGLPTDCLGRIGEAQVKMAVQLPSPKTLWNTRDSSVEAEHQVETETGTGPEEPCGLSDQHSQPSEPFQTPPTHLSKTAATATPPVDDALQDADDRVPAPLTRSPSGVTGLAPAAQQPIRPQTRAASESPRGVCSYSRHGPLALTPARRHRFSEMKFNFNTESPTACLRPHEGCSPTPPVARCIGTQPEELTVHGDVSSCSNLHAVVHPGVVQEQIAGERF